MTKLLVLSDSHGARDAIKRILNKEQNNVDAVIFLGDGLRDLELALTLCPKLRAYSVAGNCDYGALEPTDGLAAFDGVDVAALKGQITTLTNDLQTERDNRKKDAAAVKLRSTVDTFLSGKHFVNDITRESITDKLVTALGSDDARGKSIDDLFTGLVTDRDGKEIPGILVADPASKARFSSDHSGMVPPAGGAKEYVAQKYKNNPFFRG